MSAFSLQDQVYDHLQQALQADDRADMRFHIRHALQFMEDPEPTEEPEMYQDNDDRLVMRGVGPCQWIRMDTLLTADLEDCR